MTVPMATVAPHCLLVGETSDIQLLRTIAVPLRRCRAPRPRRRFRTQRIRADPARSRP